MKSINNTIIFRAKSAVKEKTVNIAGTELVMATHLTPNPETVRETEGVVISAPSHTGMQEGDKVHFHYHTICDQNCIDLVEKIYMVNLAQVFCYERDGQIFMVNNYVFVHKIKQQGKERKTDSGIYIPDAANVKEYNIGEIKFIGDNDLGLVAGDKIVYNNAIRDGLIIEVNGIEYLRFSVDLIEALWQSEQQSL